MLSKYTEPEGGHFINISVNVLISNSLFCQNSPLYRFIHTDLHLKYPQKYNTLLINMGNSYLLFNMYLRKWKINQSMKQ